MININFIGRLGADAETKVNSRNGKEFLKLRMVCNERHGGIETSSWFDVLYDGIKGGSIKQYLTKGKLLEVHGCEQVSGYIDKNGTAQVDRTVHADRIDFLPTSNRQGQATVNNNQPIEIFSAEQAAKVAISRENERIAAIEAASNVNDNIPLPF